VEPWKVGRPIVEDLHHFDDEKDLDLHQSEKSDPDPIKVKRGIRILDPHLCFEYATLALALKLL